MDRPPIAFRPTANGTLGMSVRGDNLDIASKYISMRLNKTGMSSSNSKASSDASGDEARNTLRAIHDEGEMHDLPTSTAPPPVYRSPTPTEMKSTEGHKVESPSSKLGRPKT